MQISEMFFHIPEQSTMQEFLNELSDIKMSSNIANKKIEFYWKRELIELALFVSKEINSKLFF